MTRCPITDLVLTQAQETAQELKARNIGTRHILWAITQNETCGGYQLLVRCEINITELRQILSSRMRYGNRKKSQSAATYNLRGHAVLNEAEAYAAARKAASAGTDHLVFALLKMRDSVACEALERAGLLLDDVIEQMGEPLELVA